MWMGFKVTIGVLMALVAVCAVGTLFFLATEGIKKGYDKLNN